MSEKYDPKKYKTIAEFLFITGKTNKLTLNSGNLVAKVTVIKWTKQEDQILIDMMKKRTPDAIRKRIYNLLHNLGGSINQKLQ